MQWDRRSVAQFRQVHYLQPLGYSLLCAHLPAVIDQLRSAGAIMQNHVDVFGSMVPDLERQPGDERYDTLTTVRRPVIELAFAARQKPRRMSRSGAVPWFVASRLGRPRSTASHTSRACGSIRMKPCVPTS